jgi:hypothetical protein
MMLTYHAIGDWAEGQVHVTNVADGRARLPEVEALIDQAWANALARPGAKRLFEGPVCRLETWDAQPDALRLCLSRTSYKIVLGTHFTHPELLESHGRRVMANPLGISCGLETADGWLMLGRRSASVAFYANRVHPFAGSMEPKDDGSAIDIFAEGRRELREETGLGDADLTRMRCMGLVEDGLLRHPELIMSVQTSRTRQEVEKGLDAVEHHETVATAVTRQAVEERLRDPLLTPAAVAALSLWGRSAFGEEWFSHG